MITIIPIIIFIIVALVDFVIISKSQKKINEQKAQQQKLEQDNKHYSEQLVKTVNQIQNQKYQKNSLKEQIEEHKKDLQTLSNLLSEKNSECQKLNDKIIQIKKQADATYEEEKWKINSRVVEFKKVAQESANYFVDNLEKVYQDAEAGHAQKMTRLKEELNGAAADLQKLKDTRKAAHQALLKEQEVKENKENYCLIPSPLELQDIYALQHVKRGLHKPRILSMLIWQTYFQPIAKEKFPIILQDKTKIGIYKITNLKTDECYIGQSVDVYKRFCDHCKAGLGIDTPAGNKLYKAMQEYGLQNFSFELLCECPKQELDEKERYFIQLYQSDLYGYNGTKGNK